MVERIDPARTGVKAGRVVGVLTAVLAVTSLLQAQDSFYEGMAVILGLFGVDAGISVTALFWGNVVLAVSARYTIGYVIGSLVGVLYEWLDRPPLPVLIGIVLAVGIVDGVVAGIDTRSFIVGGGYALAWLCYVPIFAWLFDPAADESRSIPRRLGES